MNREPPTIDMLPDGTFRAPPQRPVGVPLSAKLLIGAVVVAALGVSVAVAALAVWVVSLLLPVIVVAVVAAYGLYRFRLWQARRAGSGRSIRRQPFGPRGPYSGGFGQ